ncbi:MAG: tetratricopeptide repeat protein [Phycisphaerae bacterium]
MAGKIKLLTTGLIIMVLASGCVIQRKYNAKDLYERGLTDYYAGNYSTAAGNFKWALDLKKEYSGPMIGLAQCQLHFARESFTKKNVGAALQNLEEGMYWINLAVDADPGNPQVTVVRVEILNLKGEVEQALKTARWGVNVQGPNPASLLLMAKSYTDVGAYDEAEVAYKQAIAVDPKNVDVRVKTGQFYEKIGKRDLALQQYEEAYRLDPNNSDVQIRITALSGSTPEPGPENP